jgi:hypothetical protein
MGMPHLLNTPLLGSMVNMDTSSRGMKRGHKYENSNLNMKVQLSHDPKRG